VIEERLYVVTADESDYFLLSQIESLVGIPVVILKAKPPESVAGYIKKYYPEYAGELSGTPLGLREEVVLRAMLYRSSDIHFDPERDDGMIRFRIDGLMQIDQTISLDNMSELISAVKVSSGLNIAEHRIPQDGQISLWVAGAEVSMRVATIPTIYGEKMTLRILTTENTLTDLAELNMLGMSDSHLQIFLETLDTANGVILLSGPTGSGKTTTLYAALRHLKKSGTLHI
jgi:type IV pilus assembly protein PilB